MAMHFTTTDLNSRGVWYVFVEAGILADSTNPQFVKAGAQPPLEMGFRGGWEQEPPLEIDLWRPI
jgi:hypothetical protein